MGLFSRQQRLNLALEGGGAHGAFTWGVLDRLLEDETLDFGWISATSAGAVNAVAVAAGLAESGRAGARTKLRAVWEAVAKAGLPDLVRLNPLLAGISRSNAMAQMATLFSPYDFNPLGFDPFRKLLLAHIDFALLRTTPGPELLIAATDVATGRPRLFRRREITVESVLASACLPTIHHAVTIDGHAYWDGGFSANPDLLTLARESPVADTLIVKLNPLESKGVPTAARDITARINQLTFAQPMLRDIEVIETVRSPVLALVAIQQRRRHSPGAAPLPPDRCRPFHQRAGPRQQGQARHRALDLPARRRPQRNREVAGAQPPQHRPPRQHRSAQVFPRRPPSSGAASARGRCVRVWSVYSIEAACRLKMLSLRCGAAILSGICGTSAVLGSVAAGELVTQGSLCCCSGTRGVTGVGLLVMGGVAVAAAPLARSNLFSAHRVSARFGAVRACRVRWCGGAGWR